MPTADRRAFVAAAIANFLAQDYEPRELLILDDGADRVSDVVPNDPRFRYVWVQAGLSLGAKRNLACELAGGEIILHWDDDDWYPPDRISRQVAALAARGADVCGSSRLYFRDAVSGRAWVYAYRDEGKEWVAGSTLAYRKPAWERHRFRALRVGEDAHFVWDQPAERIADLDDPGLCVAAIHPGNTSSKKPGGPLWRPVDIAVVERLIEEAERQAAGRARPANQGSALVAVAGGIGHIIRATPLVRVLHALGYAVDVLCAPDYPGAVELLDGAPEIRRLILSAAAEDAPAGEPGAETDHQGYNVACFTYLARSLEPQVRARRCLRVEGRPWLREGDTRSVDRLARELGWEGEMPPPFVARAAREFDLPPDTIALHAGCKRGSPWKKWHGFVELAERLEHVVLVGTAEDLDVEGTYFAEPYAWPAHVHDYIDRLSLAETAELVRQCAALVCNDSGMQHIGAAVGTPTFPIFGITSPEREIIPAPHVHPVEKGLPCEPDCRSQPWGRRDCERHLECLRTLSVAEVLQHMQRAGVSPALRTAGRAVAIPLTAGTESLNVAVAGGILLFEVLK